MDIAGNIVDIILLVILIATVGIAAARGFIKSILSSVSWIIAAIGAAILNSPVSQWFYSAFLKDRITQTVSDRLTENIVVSDSALYAKALVDNIPGLILKAARRMGTDANYLSSVFNESKLTENNLVDKLVDIVARPIVVSILNFIFFFVLFVLIGIIVKLIARKLSDIITNSPFKTCDKLVGAAVGLVKGAILVVLLAVVLDFISGLSEGSGLSAMIESSKIVTAIETDNFIMHIFQPK